jgi:cyclopropane-fatty-acyl-phospholipid synthase
MAISRRRPQDDRGVVRLVDVLERADLQCTLVLPWKQVIPVGDGKKPSICTLVVKSERLLRRPLTELSLGRAYVEGDLDIEDFDAGQHASELFRVRDKLRSGTSPAQALRLAGQIALVPPVRSNKKAIAGHYSLPHEFFFTFLDSQWPLYSQCRWKGAAGLRTAVQNKLAHAWERLPPRKDDESLRVLDVGAGWGTLMRYRNLIDSDTRITALTLSEVSKDYIEKKRGLMRPGDEVLLEDVLEHRRRQVYDGVMILGVIEHIPTYVRLCDRLWEMLKPGGVLYLDASATREKYAGSAFTRRYTWPGPHACLALPDLTQELIYHGFAVDSVDENSKDYEKTMRRWALRLDGANGDVRRNWGEYHYRAWRVFLWGGAAAFKSGRLQSYTVVAKRREDEGPRPGRIKRVGQFAAGFR